MANELQSNSCRRTERAVSAMVLASLLFTGVSSRAGFNLLKNPDFEDAGADANSPSHWNTGADSAAKISLTDAGAHAGKHGVSVPANTTVEQSVEALPPGPYVARCWVKSPAAQNVTLLLQDPGQPWAAYTCVETKVPRDEWVQLEALCDLHRTGTLTLTLGGMSKEFRLYHGIGGEMGSPIVADDFELTRTEPSTPDLAQLGVWDAKEELPPAFDWSAKEQLSQEDLRNFLKNQRMEPFVEPFIEITQQEKIKKTEVNIKPTPRLDRPARHSLLGALSSSTVGVLVLLVLYGATVYAGYEVAIFRAQPPALVCGLSAIPLLGVLAPIVFLSIPTRIPKTAAEVREAEAAAQAAAQPIAPPAAAADEANPMQGDAAHPGNLKLAQTEAGHAKANIPETVTYQRGQFTFNRRFIETKFPGFFGVVRRDAEKDMVLVFKTNRGEFSGQRISRIAANDLHLEIQRGAATEEVLIPFQEIQQIKLKHKDATA